MSEAKEEYYKQYNILTQNGKYIFMFEKVVHTYVKELEDTLDYYEKVVQPTSTWHKIEYIRKEIFDLKLKELEEKNKKLLELLIAEYEYHTSIIRQKRLKFNLEKITGKSIDTILKDS